MKKKRCTIVVWSEQPFGNEIPVKKRRTPRLTPEKLEKQSRDEMIRALQGVFCHGRYRSWVASIGRKPA